MDANANDVIQFWFEEIDQKNWWVKDVAFDDLIRQHFLETHKKAVQGELSQWRETALGRLAEVIVLDQFSRNMFRDTKEAFAYDGLALILAQEAVRTNAQASLTKIQTSFLYLPYMHSESANIHEDAVKLYESLGQPMNLDFELKHKAIIDRFGRYPHRNEILQRVSTDEELAFLKEPGSSF